MISQIHQIEYLMERVLTKEVDFALFETEYKPHIEISQEIFKQAMLVFN